MFNCHFLSCTEPNLSWWVHILICLSMYIICRGIIFFPFLNLYIFLSQQIYDQINFQTNTNIHTEIWTRVSWVVVRCSDHCAMETSIWKLFSNFRILFRGLMMWIEKVNHIQKLVIACRPDKISHEIIKLNIFST